MAGKGSARGKRQGGRKPGVPNKATAEIKALAQNWGPDAIMKLAELAGLTNKGRSLTGPGQVAAIKELLDRGYGKAVQPLVGADGSGPIQAHAVIEMRVIDPVR